MSFDFHGMTYDLADVASIPQPQLHAEVLDLVSDAERFGRVVLILNAAKSPMSRKTYIPKAYVVFDDGTACWRAMDELQPVIPGTVHN